MSRPPNPGLEPRSSTWEPAALAMNKNCQEFLWAIKTVTMCAIREQLNWHKLSMTKFFVDPSFISCYILSRKILKLKKKLKCIIQANCPNRYCRTQAGSTLAMLKACEKSNVRHPGIKRKYVNTERNVEQFYQQKCSCLMLYYYILTWSGSLTYYWTSNERDGRLTKMKNVITTLESERIYFSLLKITMVAPFSTLLLQYTKWFKSSN